MCKYTCHNKTHITHCSTHYRVKILIWNKCGEFSSELNGTSILTYLNEVSTMNIKEARAILVSPGMKVLFTTMHMQKS